METVSQIAFPHGDTFATAATLQANYRRLLLSFAGIHKERHGRITLVLCQFTGTDCFNGEKNQESMQKSSSRFNNTKQTSTPERIRIPNEITLETKTTFKRVTV